MIADVQGLLSDRSFSGTVANKNSLDPRKSMKKSTLTIASLGTAVALLSTGCQPSNPQQDSTDTQPAGVADGTADESRSQPASNPEDDVDRLISAEDIPGDFVVDEVAIFGEPLSEEDTSVFSEPEQEKTLSECAGSVATSIEDEIDGLTSYRSMTEEGEEEMRMVITSLSRPEDSLKSLLSTIESTLDECSQITPQKALAGDIEKVETYQPDGIAGDSVCATVFSGVGGNAIVVDSCFVATDTEFSMTSLTAARQGGGMGIDEQAFSGIRKQMSDDVMPKVLEKAGYDLS